MASKRKLIRFDPETLQALETLARDRGRSVQDLADEAFADLLAKHHRPRTLKDALKQSARRAGQREQAAQEARLLSGTNFVPRLNRPSRRGGSRRAKVLLRRPSSRHD
jgi:hypothetical protein